MRCLLFMLLFAIPWSGCARTTVRKVTRGDEQGVRFYRPKPYLKISPTGKEHVVTVEIEYLPDFSEEYVVRPITGLGSNETSVELNANGTLAAMNSKTDAKVAENIEAVASLIKAVPTGSGVANTSSFMDEQRPGFKMDMPAYGVPLGLYEAVISRGPDGCKRLYGWRYVGFAPFAQCPYQSSGLECRDCHEGLFGLVNVGGAMVFCSLDDMANNAYSLTAKSVALGVAPTAATPAVMSSRNAADRFLDELLSQAQAMNLVVTREQLQVHRNAQSILVNAKNVPVAEQERLRWLVQELAKQLIPNGQATVQFEP